MTSVRKRSRNGLLTGERMAYRRRKKPLTTVPEVLDLQDVNFCIDGAIGFKGSLAVAMSILDTL